MSDVVGSEFSCCADLCSSGEPGGAPCPPSEDTDDSSNYQYCPALETGVACTATGVHTMQSISRSLYLATPLNVHLILLYFMSVYALSRKPCIAIGGCTIQSIFHTLYLAYLTGFCMSI